MAMLRSLAFVFVLALNGHPSQPPQPQAQVITESPCVCQPKAEDKPNGAKEEEGYWSKVLKPDILPVWIGGVAAFLASIAGLSTLYFLKDQSKIGLLAAQAAKKSADIAANAERAWVTTEVRFSSKLPDISKEGGPVRSMMIVTMKNAGRSPAEITRIQALSFIYPAEYVFPENPIYGETDDMFQVHAAPGEIIPAGEERMFLSPLRHSKLLSDEEIAEIMSGTKILYCYGKIEYKDLSGENRITQFGFTFYVRTTPEDSRPETMYRLKSRAYNYTT
jgi:hypothetical protein